MSLYICNICTTTSGALESFWEFGSKSTDAGFGFEVLSPDNGIFRKPDDVHLNHCLLLVILSVGKKPKKTWDETHPIMTTEFDPYPAIYRVFSWLQTACLYTESSVQTPFV